MKEEIVHGLKQLLAKPTSIVLTNHVNPDGDAMGSALGLKIILENLGHNAHVVVPNAYPNFLHWLPNNRSVIIAENTPDKAAKIVGDAEVIIHLDYNAYSRTGGLEEALRKATAKRVIIDHHQQPETWADVLYSDTQMSSTCQMVAELALAMDWQNYINADAANCLYTGIITDTGSFRFPSANARTLQIAGILLAAGADKTKIYDRIFDTSSVGRLKLLGALLNKLAYFPEKRATLLHLDAKTQRENNYTKGDSEGFVNYGLSISGVQLAIFLREDEDLIKISLRSKGNLNVNELSREKFNGGGHINAAGGSLKMPLADALAYAENVIKNLQNE